MQINFAILLICFQFVWAQSTHAESNELWAVAESATHEISIVGFTRAHATIPLATEVAGKVKEIFADIGESIPEHGKLACLDDVFVQFDIQAASNQIAQHTNQMSYYQKEVSRHEQLVAKQSAAVNVLDNLTRELVNSQREMQAAHISKQRFDELKRRHCIKAPIGWLVIDRAIEIGQWIREGEVVAHIGDYSKLIVPLMLTEHELAALKQKGRFDVLLTEHHLKVPAVIEHISPEFDENTRKILVELAIQDQLPEYRGGIRVELTLAIPSEDHVFSISEKALDQRYEEYWLQSKDGKSIRVNLLGEQKDGKVKINSPEIKLGDQFRLNRK
ncbi:efflux RND transporter periplasmic adaptor subunit [Methylomonas sp. LL1]|uniref:efflux RND transporter periplasmic adaptor subunit n=1 Tax=Methylomonas sp. LL1 TaxID=2785785 RepID=UPI0018C3ABB3|nr:efflux RND transporter periplasmic adaptor subunit [Methylomonas sp. LL1]QPK61918.1 efflux RND transporter periplasmic adaptor subunit [Methylomonas sp. LL1]CAG1020420.1 hypothetical protein MTYM_00257 [Methylococcales bacterium]